MTRESRCTAKQARGWSLWPALLYPSLQNFESPPIQKKRSVSRQSRLRRAMLGISARAICNHSDEQIESTATRREQHKSRLHLWCEICSPLLSGRKDCSIESYPDMELVCRDSGQRIPMVQMVVQPRISSEQVAISHSHTALFADVAPLMKPFLLCA